ncbi:MAG: DUF5320 domain-containing protein [SAR324 cluster bacterium]|uniref:DUF5320 domain-containing protein n=1 Tax=SAR324 cluster bacterium TaxID=2024889 RepID=A0A7X9FPU0_9DELT|nr:DUF5320 domain-containing protein [SAR324 cluster bacterium]
MPRGDGSGPIGAGSMTGRRLGYCAGFGNPGFENTGTLRNKRGGFGRGAGFRQGIRRGARFQPDNFPVWSIVPRWSLMSDYDDIEQGLRTENEKALLKEEIKNLESRLQEVQKYLSELDSGDSDNQ